ncbi:MAG: SDR family oxidoreductase [Oscillochloris sp.]|nr:SDR family oxidoreductase [Oscillochloris sp.]
MRAKGIIYDTGFIHKGVSSREPFGIEVVTRELQIIAHDLHCTAVRVTGGDPERLDIAARIAAEAGLEVWFSPFTCDLTQAEMLTLLTDCAERAERLHQQGAEVVYVVGAEISLLNKGFLPGDTLGERMELLSDLQRLRPLIAQVPAQVNDFLARAVAAVRERFGGKVTYAAMPFEGVDWALFDIISLDLYRSVEVADRYAAAVRSLVAQGKPVAITEFGSATYRGAADKGARGGEIVVWDHKTVIPLGLNGDYHRDEEEQARYIRELLAIFVAEGVDSAFVCTFVQYQLPHRPNAPHDLDMGSYSIVKVYEDRLGETYPDMAWEPKAAFAALAEAYGSKLPL